jgi:hypothetical protein
MAAVLGFPEGNVPASASHAASVTPSDTSDLAYVTTSLWLGGIAADATLAVIMAGGESQTFTFGNAAAMNPFEFRIRVRRVLATGTANISNIVALWST